MKNKKLRWLSRIIFKTLTLCFQCSLLYADTVKVGTTFSPTQCKYLGIDWKKAYRATLDMGFDVIRLGAYWNEIEKESGIYDFSDLDYQISEAGGKSIPIILVVGMKVPRWPEYFIPDWMLKKESLSYWTDISRNEFLRRHALNFIKKTIMRYEESPNIYCWQVENESLDRFGKKRWIVNKAFLKEEIGLVRNLDKKKRSILLTVATFPNKYLRFIMRLIIPHDPIEESLRMGDILGINVYLVVGERFFGRKFYFRTNPKEREEYISYLIDRAKKKGKKIWVTELQAEPWEPGQVAYRNEARPLTESPKETKEYFEILVNFGIDTILLWGAEYWYFRKEQYGDTEWQEMVVDILKFSEM